MPRSESLRLPAWCRQWLAVLEEELEDNAARRVRHLITREEYEERARALLPLDVHLFGGPRGCFYIVLNFERSFSHVVMRGLLDFRYIILISL